MSEPITVPALLEYSFSIAGKSTKNILISEPLLDYMIVDVTEATRFSLLAFRCGLIARQILPIDGDTDFIPVTSKMLGVAAAGEESPARRIAGI